MKNARAWTGGRAVGELPSGLVAAFPFPFHCSLRLLSSTLVFFSPVTFPPVVARVPGRGLPRSLTPAQLWRKCPVQTCVRPETVLHFSSRVLRASPCASAAAVLCGLSTPPAPPPSCSRPCPLSGLLALILRPWHFNPEYQLITSIALADFTGKEVPDKTVSALVCRIPVLARCLL